MEISNRRLYVIVFMTGAIVMILELVGSRILAPILGTSIYVWTSLIGVILGAMSLGYYMGGKIADKNPKVQTFSNIIFIAGIFIFFIIIMKKPILDASLIFQPRDASIFSAIALFSIPCMLLGAVSPYSVKLAMRNLETSGNTVGNLYAVSTFGSIFGTFLAGFYLIPSYGSTNILYALALSLFFISLIAGRKKENMHKTSLLMIFVFALTAGVNAMEKNSYVVDEDSEYNHIRVYDTTSEDNKKIRIMAVENFYDSGMYLDSDDLVFEYSKYFRLADLFKKDMHKVVIFGGAAYTIPKDLMKRKDDTKIDVVEIDPRTTKIAEKYFNLNLNDPRLKIYHQDARTFLNNVSKADPGKYDAVYNDAFSSTCATPFQLTTREALQEISYILKKDGVYVMNVISSISGEQSNFFKAEYATMKEVFKNIYIFPTVTNTEKNADVNQNIVVIATNADIDFGSLIENNKESEYGVMLNNIWKYEINVEDSLVLTDDYAPVDHLTSNLCQIVSRN